MGPGLKVSETIEKTLHSPLTHPCSLESGVFQPQVGEKKEENGMRRGRKKGRRGLRLITPIFFLSLGERKGGERLEDHRGKEEVAFVRVSVTLP